ncbi:hypothetical protein FGO68_gene8714 [Halteria grandinella]|uniref:Uncharacterized protein n=1 Tax=Halteria grandinella TaxID=5974 RepID=A0A8J8T5E7_HALGN|nr:hypothetical protein FGO68_gene8714 [Halteria grandinella]
MSQAAELVNVILIKNSTQKPILIGQTQSFIETKRHIAGVKIYQTNEKEYCIRAPKNYDNYSEIASYVQLSIPKAVSIPQQYSIVNTILGSPNNRVQLLLPANTTELMLSNQSVSEATPLSMTLIDSSLNVLFTIDSSELILPSSRCTNPFYCLRCQSNDPSLCIECKNKSHSIVDGECLYKCPSIYYFKNETTELCVRCPNHCKKCVKADYCQVCEEAYYWVKGGVCKASKALTMSACNSTGYYLEGAQCKQCLPLCEVCSSTILCTRCKQGLILAHGLCFKPCSQIPGYTVEFSFSAMQCQYTANNSNSETTLNEIQINQRVIAFSKSCPSSLFLIITVTLILLKRIYQRVKGLIKLELTPFVNIISLAVHFTSMVNQIIVIYLISTQSDNTNIASPLGWLGLYYKALLVMNLICTTTQNSFIAIYMARMQKYEIKERTCCERIKGFIVSLVVTFHYQIVRQPVKQSMYINTLIANLICPHLTTLITNSVTIKYFIESKYTPASIAIIENSILHGLCILMSMIMVLYQCTTKNVSPLKKQEVQQAKGLSPSKRTSDNERK